MQVIKNFMSSAAEAELGDIFIVEKENFPISQTLIEMGWPQPSSPIKTDNSTASGVVNDTIITRETNSMNLRFHWLRCREAQQKIRLYNAPGSKNSADYITNHHLPIYHVSKLPLFSVAAHRLYQALISQC